MSGEEAAKQSELAELSKVINELRESVKPAKEKKPWVFTEGRKANFEKANAKRIAAAEKKKVEAAIQEAERKAFEEERRKFYEMAMKNPTGHTVSQAPEVTVSALAPNKVAEPVAVQPAPVAEKKEVRFVEKPIMADEVESVVGEHDHDDGWMTKANSAVVAAPEAKEEMEEIPAPVPLQRQTNRAAVAADWAEHQMSQMASRKRAWQEEEQLAQAQAMPPTPSYRMGTGAGNHAPYEGDPGYRDGRRPMERQFVTPEEALQLLSMPKEVALRYLAERIAPNPQDQSRLLRSYQDREEYMEPEESADDYLQHTRHYSVRHPSQLHSATQSTRYQPRGDSYVWL